MSFILDALKKSEAERQRQAGPALLEMRVVRPQRRWPLWGTIVLVLLLANGAVLTWLVLRKGSAPTVDAAAGNVAQPSGSGPAAGTGAAGASAADTAAAGASVSGPASAQTAQLAASPLAASPSSAPPLAPASGMAPAGQPGAENPADFAPAQATGAAGSANNAGDANSGARYGDTGEPPAYETISGHLPELQLNLHVFADNPAERYALVNMHKVREGDVTPEGARVERITQKGVVMEYRGSEFLLAK